MESTQTVPLRSATVSSESVSALTDAAGKPILADRYKTKMCRNYIDFGACPYEVRCMFAHGEHELRTAEMNIRDGLITEDAIRAFRRFGVSPSMLQSQSHRRGLSLSAKRGAAAPPYTRHPPQPPLYSYEDSCYANYGDYTADYYGHTGGGRGAAFSRVYTHNPYNCDLLYTPPPPPPTLSAAPALFGAAEGAFQYRLRYDGFEAECAGVAHSSSSSIGSESGDFHNECPSKGNPTVSSRASSAPVEDAEYTEE